MDIQVARAPQASTELAAVLSGIGDAAIAVDAEGRVVAANHDACSLLGLASEELVDRPFHEVIGHQPDTRAGRPVPDCVMCAAIGGGRAGVVPGSVTSARHEQIPVQASIGGVTADDVPRVVLLRDDRPRRKREEALVERASRDPVTGLPLRQALSRQSAPSATAVGAGAALMLIDLDGFKDVNDRFGHSTGDVVLSAFAARLQTLVRQGDLLVRYGGDEFVLAALDCDLDTARSIADRIVQAVTDPFSVHGQQVHLGVSIGVAISERPASLEELVPGADEALQDAKNSGKGCAVIAGDAPQQVAGALRVRVAEARAWAAYVRALRTEIAGAKEAGRLPSHLAAPESVHRTLLGLLLAIDHLPDDAPTADLALPHPQRLLPFIIYVAAVLQWVDRLVAQGVLSTPRSPAADRFLRRLRGLADDLQSPAFTTRASASGSAG